MAVTKVAKRRRIIPLKDLPALVRSFVDAKVAEKNFGQRRADLRLQILDVCEHDGEEDENGHFWLDLPEHVQDSKGNLTNRVKMQRNASEHLRNEAEVEAILEDLGLLEACLTTITVLDEEKIINLHAAGDISEAHLARMYEEKVTWSLPQL